MKRYALMIAAALAAGAAFAQEGDPEANPPPPAQPGACDMSGPRGAGKMAMRGERPAGPMSPEMMKQMRADHKAIRELGEAARAETDEAKKAELVGQLRAKLGEVADRMQAHQEQRLAQAEERLANLKAKIEEGKTNRDSRIEEQVQRILSGERPRRPDAFKQFPHAKGGMRGDRGDWSRGDMAPPPGAEGDELAPPPPEDMPDDAPPPPEE